MRAEGPHEPSDCTLQWTRGPVGVSYFPRELVPFPKFPSLCLPLLGLTFAARSWGNLLSKFVCAGKYDKGGHSAAFVRPDMLAEDPRKMYGKDRGAFGVV